MVETSARLRLEDWRLDAKLDCHAALRSCEFWASSWTWGLSELVGLGRLYLLVRCQRRDRRLILLFVSKLLFRTIFRQVR